MPRPNAHLKITRQQPGGSSFDYDTGDYTAAPAVIYDGPGVLTAAALNRTRTESGDVDAERRFLVCSPVALREGDRCTAKPHRGDPEVSGIVEEVQPLDGLGVLTRTGQSA